MKSTVINTSKEMTAYSDFPPEPSMANFMHNTEMYRYLNSYAEHYNLKKYIKFNHKVSNVERTSDYRKTGQWKVSYEDGSAVKSSEVFDGVLLCCGHHALPRMPAPWPGQDRFKGRIIHSHSYRDHKGYEDKVVVVVGVGNSGGDLAVELSRIAKQVYLVTRRGTWVCNRIFDYGEPFDMALNRKYLNDARSLVPDWLVNTFVEQKMNKRFDHERYGLKPKHRIFSAHPTVNDELPNRIACGTVRVKPNISEFTENGVTFEDGTHVENVDEVILATGFEFHFPIVEGGKLIPVHDNVVDLYEYMYPTETADHNSLVVIGLIQPVGSIMPISEMQARVFYENLFGQHKIPGSEEMKKSIREKREAMEARYVNSPRHTIQVDFITYMDELADLVGCKPNVKDLLLSDPLLALQVYFGPYVPYVYRLNGPHSWSGARQAIMNVDERVFKATNSAAYSPRCAYYGYVVVALLAFLILWIIF
ncbi:Flavin-binding monooxygenase-like protein [Ancylostoma caninum]|uniref:Flavin-containing monooxygenase n=1 Tax=Ancylostoma caninum TaxID=29170 RepID=A0A368G467_ANCCA|nr:Flavin-binding monooxygenase-like protein [Ancylostoma caninum]